MTTPSELEHGAKFKWKSLICGEQATYTSAHMGPNPHGLRQPTEPPLLIVHTPRVAK